MTVPFAHVMTLAVILFLMGFACLLSRRRNLIMMLIGIEIMLNSAILVFTAGSAYRGGADGQVFALIVIAMTSAEVSLALALVVYLFARKKSLDSDAFGELRG